MGQYAPLRHRFLANLIDWGVKILIEVGIVVSLETLFPSSSYAALDGALILVFSVLAVVAYDIVPLSRSGATVGKRMMGIRVVGQDGRLISLGRSFLREVVGKWLSGLVFSLGYLWAVWDKDKQAWHDKLVGTYVVRR